MVPECHFRCPVSSFEWFGESVSELSAHGDARVWNSDSAFLARCAMIHCCLGSHLGVLRPQVYSESIPRSIFPLIYFLPIEMLRFCSEALKHSNFSVSSPTFTNRHQPSPTLTSQPIPVDLVAVSLRLWRFWMLMKPMRISQKLSAPPFCRPEPFRNCELKMGL